MADRSKQSRLLIRWTPQGGTEQTIDIDCSVEETYEQAAEASEHAVEEGANVSDHVRPKNESGTIEAIISGSPIVSPQFGMDGATGSVQAMTITVGGQQLSANTWQFSQPFKRVAACDEQLRTLVRTGQRLTIFTGVRIVADTVIERYSWRRSVVNGRDLAFTIEWKRIRLATSRTVAAAVPRTRNGHAQRNQGAQPATPASPGSSAAFRLLFGGSS